MGHCSQLFIVLCVFQCMGNSNEKGGSLPWLTWTWSVRGNWGSRGSPWWGHGSPWARPRAGRTFARGSPSASSWIPEAGSAPSTRTPERTWSTSRSWGHTANKKVSETQLEDDLQVALITAYAVQQIEQSEKKKKATWTEACCTRTPGASSMHEKTRN